MKIKAVAVAVAAVFLLVAVPLAFAAEQTKETYVAEVEPICEANTKANEKLLKNVKPEVKAGKLGPAGASLLQAARALKKTWSELSAVPQPAADAAKLTKWLGYVKTEATLFEKAGKLLKSGKKAQAQQIVNKLSRNANLANFEVVSFGFHYCKFEPSKFL
ncbi:MAG: hypothetical protein JSU06_01330 [Actinobacteria bacterium]|nr:hypothetical protein [Actinomycetota bacterium]